MRKMSFCFMLSLGVISVSAVTTSLDRVFVYLNGKLAGTWRADESGIVYIKHISDGDTLVFKARTDLGGLGNSSIDVKDDNGVTVQNIQSPNSSSGAANFVYIFRLKKINIPKVSSLQVFLNFDPARDLQPPTIASITIPQK